MNDIDYGSLHADDIKIATVPSKYLEDLETYIDDLEALVARQRVIIERYNEVVFEAIKVMVALGRVLPKLEDAYDAAQDTSTMTGTSEK